MKVFYNVHSFYLGGIDKDFDTLEEAREYFNKVAPLTGYCELSQVTCYPASWHYESIELHFVSDKKKGAM